MNVLMRKVPYLIANPIYDGVFKALLTDLDLARDILSVLLGLEIGSLRFASLEVAARKAAPEHEARSRKTIPVPMRLDFCAVIRTAEGAFRQVLIELQKTRLSGDILRFRHDLEERYIKLEEVTLEAGSVRAEPLPLFCVYLLGFEIDGRLPMVTRLERRYLDAVRKEFVEFGDAVRPDWPEPLTHDACFAQISRIRREAGGNTALE